MSWPYNYREIKLKKLQYLETLNNDIELRYIAQRYYKYHPVDWINDWCVTFDPRRAGTDEDPRLMPFKLFPRQVDLVQFLEDCLNDKESGLIEKSRDMGASWVAAAFTAHKWLYWEGTVIGWGSRKEEYVDDANDPKAVFPKIRQILEWLPQWMLPYGFNKRTDLTYMKIFNRENGSVITGEAGDNIGRGGRTTIYFKDESAHYERPEKIEAALGDNTDVQIDISSVNGASNVFYRRRQAGEIWYPNIKPTPNKTRIFILDWRDHPGKSQEWYDARRAKAEAEGMLHILAQEIDRDYLASVDNIIIRPEWVEAAIDAHLKLGIQEIGENVAGQDIADGGGDKNAIACRKGVILKAVEHWAGEAGDAPSIGIPLMLEYKTKEIYYDSVGVGTGYKVGVNNLQRTNSWPKHIQVFPWSGGDSVIDPEKHVIPNDKESPKNEDHYLNLKAQAWFMLRTRFYKTFRAIRYGETYDHKDLISIDSKIPRIHELKSELSQAVHKPSANGKTMVDKKPEGARSPNLADAVVICYCGKSSRNSLFNF